MPIAGRGWHGGAILVCEDNLLMAEVVCEFLRDCGLAPVGPAATLEESLRQAQDGRLDGAILDVKLRNRSCFPICPILATRHIPFLFLTGYRELAAVPAEFRGAAMIRKPFEPAEMKGAIARMLDLADEHLPQSVPGPALRD